MSTFSVRNTAIEIVARQTYSVCDTIQSSHVNHKSVNSCAFDDDATADTRTR